MKLFLALIGFMTIGQFGFSQTIPGSTFSNPQVVTNLPLLEQGMTRATTCGFGNNYTTFDIACAGNFMSGEEKIYSFTPTTAMPNVQVSMTNISDNFSGLFVTDDSTALGSCLGADYGPNNNDRIVANLSLSAGVTYYFIVSTWANPKCLEFDFQVLDQTCPAPDAFVATAVGYDSVAVSWMEAGSATNWEVEIGPFGYTPGSGMAVAKTVMNHSFTGLSAQTDYDLYVRAGCGVNDSSYWVGPLNVTTGCAPATDFSEDFATLSNYEFPFCWTKHVYGDNSGTGTPVIEAYQYGTPHSSPMHLRFSNSNHDSAVLIAVLNQVTNLGAGTHKLSFYGKDFNASQLVVGTMTDPSDTNTFVGHDTVTLTSIYSPYTVYFDNYSGSAEYIALRRLQTSTYRTTYIDDVVYEAIPACIAPTDLAGTPKSLTSIELSWNQYGTASSWDVEYGPAGFTPGTGTVVTASSNPYTLSGLTASTDYDVYVRQNCGSGSLSTSEGPFSFRIDFNPPLGVTCTTGSAGIMFVDDMEKPSGWTGDFGTSSPNWRFGYAPNNWSSGPDMAASGDNWTQFLAPWSVTTPVTKTIVTPMIDLTSVSGDAELSFYLHAYGDSMGDLNVGIGATATGPFTVVATQSGQYQTATTDPWVHVGVNIASYAGQQIYVSFAQTHSKSSSRGAMAIDLVKVEGCVSCPAPTMLSATPNPTDADIYWSSTASDFEYQYGASGFPVGTGTSGIATDTIQTITGLTPATLYDYYVRAICGTGDTSIWVGPYTFETTCAALSDFSESFTNATVGELPSCWTGLVEASNTFAYVRTTFSNFSSNTPPNYVRFSNSNDDDAGIFLISPEITNFAAQSHRARFYARYGSTGNIDIVVGTIYDRTDSSTFVAVDTVTVSNTYAEYTVDFDTYTDTGLYLAFRPVFTSTYRSVYMDDIIWESIPTCRFPKDLSAKFPTLTSVNLEWTERNTATQWEVEYGPTGYFQGAGTKAIAGSNPFTVAGLTAGADYDFYVRSICSPGDTSIWSTVGTFTMPCGTVTSFFEDFESYPSGNTSMATCWNGVTYSLPTASPRSNIISFSGPIGTRHVQLSASSDVNSQVYLVSEPLSNVAAGTHRVRFFSRGSNDLQSVIVGAMGDVADTNTFTPIDTIALTNSYLEYVVDFDGFSGVGNYVAFKKMVTSEQYRVVYVDEIRWEPIPTCIRVEDVTTTTTNANGFTSTWNDVNGASSWELQYDTVGFTAGTGNSLIASVTSQTVTGLTAATYYEYYVRAICGSGDSSMWRGPFTVYTDYCQAMPTSVSGNGIINVTMDTVNNSSTGSTTYENYTNQVASAQQSEGLDVTITMSLASSFATYDVYAWIDFNDNMSFNDPGEMFHIGDNVNSTVMQTLTIPLTAPLGMHRMRIGAARYSWSNVANVDPCYSGTWGCFEDYTVDVTAAPTCVVPDGLTATNINDVSIDLGWMDYNSATSFEIEYGPLGFTPGSGTIVAVTTNPYTVTGLTPDSDYEFTVRSMCSVTDSSSWATRLTAATVCSVFATPFIEDVENHAAGGTPYGQIDNCWMQTGPTGYDYNWNVAQAGIPSWRNSGPSGANSGSKYFHVYSGSGSTGDTAMLISPKIDISTLIVPRLKYFYHMYGGTMGNLYLEVHNGTSWIMVDSIIGEVQTSQSDSWLARDIQLPFSGGTTQMRFIAVRDGSQGFMALDDVKIEDTFSENIAMLDVTTLGDYCGLGADSI
ncbi:MAG: fibronectin type III domain-containing protein, partial [Salibacteraceae bacterium]